MVRYKRPGRVAKQPLDFWSEYAQVRNEQERLALLEPIVKHIEEILAVPQKTLRKKALALALKSYFDEFEAALERRS